MARAARTPFSSLLKKILSNSAIDYGSALLQPVNEGPTWRETHASFWFHCKITWLWRQEVWNTKWNVCYETLIVESSLQIKYRPHCFVQIHFLYLCLEWNGYHVQTRCLLSLHYKVVVISNVYLCRPPEIKHGVFNRARGGYNLFDR